MIFVLSYSLICPLYHHANNSISTIGYLFMRGVTYCHLFYYIHVPIICINYLVTG